MVETLNVELNLIKLFVSALTGCKETLKISVSKLDVEPIRIARLMKNVTEPNPFPKQENANDFAWEVLVLLVQVVQLKTTERYVLAIHLLPVMATLDAENVSTILLQLPR